MNIDLEKDIVQSLSSLYPLQEFEEKAIHTVLDALPSAQPEPCEDAVSREAAVAKVNEYASIWMEYTEGMSKDEIAQAALDSAKQTMNQILSELPSAEPEQRTGKWIPQDHNKRAGNISTCVYCYPICSKCGKVGIETYNYCPNCGAKMEVTT